MPPKEKVVDAIKQADFILLDGQICREYDGKQLLPLCKGKKVLGISTQFDLGDHNWFGKDRLTSSNKAQNQDAAMSLKEKVEQMLAQ